MTFDMGLWGSINLPITFKARPAAGPCLSCLLPRTNPPARDVSEASGSTRPSRRMTPSAAGVNRLKRESVVVGGKTSSRDKFGNTSNG